MLVTHACQHLLPTLVQYMCITWCVWLPTLVQHMLANCYCQRLCNTCLSWMLVLAQHSNNLMWRRRAPTLYTNACVGCRSTMKECADFLENQPSKWSWRRLVTSNDRKLNANALQKRLSDFVKQMQVRHAPKLVGDTLCNTCSLL